MLEAEELVDDINELTEALDCSDNETAIDFAQSVQGKAEDILASIMAVNHATDGQLTALRNMKEGLQKWADRLDL